MSSTGTSTSVASPSTAVQREEPARAFLSDIATEIQRWLNECTKSGEAQGKHYVISAMLPNGQEVVVESLSAHGHALVKLVGRVDDTPRLVVAHYHSVHLMAKFVSESLEASQKREIGFHTLMIGDREIKPDV